MHGVTHTIEQIRERGVPGFDVDVIGTDPGVDRRLPAAAELELPFYEGMTLGVPGLPDLVVRLRVIAMITQRWEACCTAGFRSSLSQLWPGLPPWGPHVRFRRGQTLVREGSPLVKLRHSA